MFPPELDEAIFLGYSSKLKAYRVLNPQTRLIEGSFDITFDDQYIVITNLRHDTLYIIKSDSPLPDSPVSKLFLKLTLIPCLGLHNQLLTWKPLKFKFP